jgi:Fe-S cluster biogenesis protein NfuA
MTAEELIVNVEKALEEIRPFLVTDGGDISLVNIENNIVRVQLEGSCISCPVNQMTLTNGVEATIKRYAPQIEKVIEVSQELTK